MACNHPPAPPLGDPARYHIRVSAGHPAQHRRLTRQRLVQLALTRALEDPGDLGEQVSAGTGELAELGHRGGFLGCGELASLRVMARLAVQLGDEQPVSLRALIDHVF